MKKMLVVFAMLFSVIVPINANAETPKSLVVIDSYFDSRAVGAKIICIPTVNCSTVYKPATSLSDDTNHGVAMVEVAKKQSPVLNIIALQSAANPTSGVNAGTFIEALKWINNNSDNIGAVSVSRRFNGTTACTPATVNTANYGGVVEADKTIRSLITSLKQKGIPVFAATGNIKGKTVDYPACILDTNSVSVGSINKSGLIVSSYQYDTNTDYFVSGSVYSYKSTVFGLIPNTTSSATAAIAAKYVSGQQLSKINLVQSN